MTIAALVFAVAETFVELPAGRCAVTPFRVMRRELGLRGVAMFSCVTEIPDRTGDGVADRTRLFVLVDRKGREVCQIVELLDRATGATRVVADTCR